MRFVICLLFVLSANAYAEDPALNADNCGKALKTGDDAKAIEYANKALAVDKNHRAALLCKGRALASEEKYDDSLSILKVVDAMPAEPFDQMIVIATLGDVQKDAGQYDNATATLERGLILARDKKNKRFERVYMNLLGDVQVLTKQDEAALKNYMAAGDLSANENERADNDARIAATSSRLGKSKMAVDYQFKAMMLEARVGDMDSYANAELELGKYFNQDHDPESAEKSINKVLKVSKEQGGAYWEAKSYYYLAQLRMASNKTDEAKVLLQNAQKIFNAIGETELNKEISQTLAKLM